ncbi:uncharacterized protein LOC119582135 [Penaeus monodon]|uniref:uncharacterized protein LOC119582135 n=1 Tax=Penaeus monodon TaxID=6687 RepID=UPI0018A7ABDC|nr:uncharacterized protein LOC119582135 [Penaeus monodon]
MLMTLYVTYFVNRSICRGIVCFASLALTSTEAGRLSRLCKQFLASRFSVNMIVMAESKKMMSVQKFMEAISYVYLSNHPSPYLKKPIVPQVRLERLPHRTIEKYTKRQQRHKSKSSKPAISSLNSSTKKASQKYRIISCPSITSQNVP